MAVLVELIVENNPSDTNFSISTKINTLLIEERSIEAFLAHKDIPDPLSRYHITSIKYDLNNEQEKTIGLISETDSQDSSYLSVSGLDQPWVLGKFQQINDFINSK